MVNFSWLQATQYLPLWITRYNVVATAWSMNSEHWSSVVENYISQVDYIMVNVVILFN